MLDLFSDQNFLRFQSGKFILIFLDSRRIIGFNQPLEESLRFLLQQGNLAGQGLGLVCRLSCAIFPQVFEHRADQRKQIRRWAELSEERFKFALQLFFRDGLAIVRTSLGKAQVIGILSTAACGPACGYGFTASGTGYKAPKRKIIIEIFAGRSLCPPFQTVLDGLEGLETNQRLVLGGMQM